MKEILIQTIPLETGLSLELYDDSRKIAGDRYRVTLIARIRIPVDAVPWAEEEGRGGVDRKAAVETLGETVTFEKRMDRHFIDAREKEATLESMKESMLSTALPYFSRSAFAEKTVRRAYREAVIRKRRYSGA